MGSGCPPGCRLLLVEDNDTLRSVIEVTLAQAGYDVTARGSAESALVAARRSGGFDAAVVDLTLPGMCGRRLVDRLERENLASRFLVVSGHDPASLGWVRDWRADIDVLVKPFGLARLCDALSRLTIEDRAHARAQDCGAVASASPRL